MTVSGDTDRLDVLARLIARLRERAAAPVEESYTARLLAAGPHACAKKFGEEAVELALALVDGDETRVRAEAADVIYHLLVALMARDVAPARVMEELQARFARSGLEEKAARGR